MSWSETVLEHVGGRAAFAGEVSQSCAPGRLSTVSRKLEVDDMSSDAPSTRDVGRLRSFGQLLGVDLSEEEIRRTLAPGVSVSPAASPAPHPEGADGD